MKPYVYKADQKMSLEKHPNSSIPFWYNPQKWFLCAFLGILAPVFALNILTSIPHQKPKEQLNSIAPQEVTPTNESPPKSSPEEPRPILDGSTVANETLAPPSETNKIGVTEGKTFNDNKSIPLEQREIEKAKSLHEINSPPSLKVVPELHEHEIIGANNEAQITAIDSESNDTPPQASKPDITTPSDPEICLAVLNFILKNRNKKLTPSEDIQIYVGHEKIRTRLFYIFLSNDGKNLYRAYLEKNTVHFDSAQQTPKGLKKAKWKDLNNGAQLHVKLTKHSLNITTFEKSKTKQSATIEFKDLLRL